MTELLTAEMRQRIDADRAIVRFGFPFWLRPFVAKDVAGITLGRTIFVASGWTTAAPAELHRLLLHELAHVRQIRRLGFGRFLFLYLSEYWRNRRTAATAAEAYRNISFEVEAVEEESAVHSAVVSGEAPRGPEAQSPGFSASGSRE